MTAKKMSLEERIKSLVSLKSIEGVQPRAFKRLMKELAVDTNKSVKEIENLFTAEMNKAEYNRKMARAETICLLTK